MADSFPSRVCVVGATSTIARATMQRLAARGCRLHLGARNVDEAERIGQDLHVRHGVPVTCGLFEALDEGTHRTLLDDAQAALGGLDAVLVFAGMLGDQERAESDPAHARRVIDVTFTGVASLLTHAANLFEDQGHGHLVVFSSVAGDRGRPSNYVYGSAKAGLTAFLDGLRGRLHTHGVQVLTVKPGPVDTKMTQGMDDLPLLAAPETVAADVVRAIEKGTDELYTPGIWRLIMTLIRLIPTRVYKRLSL